MSQTLKFDFVNNVSMNDIFIDEGINYFTYILFYTCIVAYVICVLNSCYTRANYIIICHFQSLVYMSVTLGPDSTRRRTVMFDSVLKNIYLYQNDVNVVSFLWCIKCDTHRIYTLIQLFVSQCDTDFH